MSDLAPRGVALGLATLEGVEYPLFPEERALIADAVTARRIEFSAGRHLARRLLAAAGIAAGPLPRLADGGVQWPNGADGSISHCEGLCAVAVAGPGAPWSIGIDVEPHQPIELQLWDELFVEAERTWLDRRQDAAVHWSRLLFCAKEAFYKALQPPDVSSFRDLCCRVRGDEVSVSTLAQPTDAQPVAVRVFDRWCLALCCVRKGA